MNIFRGFTLQDLLESETNLDFGHNELLLHGLLTLTPGLQDLGLVHDNIAPDTMAELFALLCKPPVALIVAWCV